jgi:hypothetical protein
VNLPVRLAGHTATWRFRDSDDLDAWLAGQPWRQQGGVKVLRIAAAELAPELAAAIARAVRGSDDVGDVRVRALSTAALAAGLRTAVGESLELPGGTDRREYLRLLARELGTPTVFVAEPAEWPAGAALLHDADELSEEVARSPSAPAVTFVLLDTPERPLSGLAADLATGRPVDSLFRLASGPDLVLWRAYVHARLAWEAAGDLARAKRADELGFGLLRTGDDAGLERLLNSAAEQTLARLDAGVAQQAGEYLQQLTGGGRNRKWLAQTATQLTAAGVLWKPLGEVRPRPAPWLARALLPANRAGTARALLRAVLVCAPLAHQVLDRCFDLEAAERAVCSPPPGARVTNPDILRRFDKFEHGDPDSDIVYYPRGCPAVPASAWDFTSFGEFLDQLPPDPARSPAQHQLRRLRNAIAHGHYICWETIQALRRVQEQLER